MSRSQGLIYEQYAMRGISFFFFDSRDLSSVFIIIIALCRLHHYKLAENNGIINIVEYGTHLDKNTSFSSKEHDGSRTLDLEVLVS